MNKRPVIIDADPGMDDAQAIMLVNGCGLFDIKAVCAVHGNVGLEYTSKNALYLAGLAGLQCPVCVGASEAIIARVPRAAYAHGGNGLAGLEFTVDESKFSEKKPWDIMYEEAVKCEGELEIFAIGPLTNVALAVLKYPELPSMIKQLTIMGGGATRGNASAYAEFNIAQDPHALQILLDAGFKKFVMVDLDCCGTAFLTEEEGLGFTSLPLGNPWKEFYLKKEEHRKNRPANLKMPMRKGHYACDAAAAFVMAHPEHVVTEDLFCVCELKSSVSVGQTVFDTNGRTGNAPNVTLARSVDREKYSEFYIRCLESYSPGEEE